MKKTLFAIRGMAFALVAAVAAPAAEAARPSFDCDLTMTAVEKLICGDDDLAALDVKMAKSFAVALAKAPADAVVAMKTAQSRWRAKLLSCGVAADPRGCARDAYLERLKSF